MDKNEIKSRLVQIGTEVRDTAGKLTRTAVDNSRKVSEKIQIQSRIHKIENRLDEIYAAMGRKYEELYGNRNEPEFVKYMTAIADARAQLIAAHAELKAVENNVVCEKCRKPVTENQNFCPCCGTKIIRKPTVEAEVVQPEQEKESYEDF